MGHRKGGFHSGTAIERQEIRKTFEEPEKERKLFLGSPVLDCYWRRSEGGPGCGAGADPK